MSEELDRTTWIVIGASGFVGSQISAHARSQGIVVIELAAPRLQLSDTTLLSARQAVDQAAGIEDELVLAFEGARVIINAAGLASPNAEMTSTLVAANTALPLLLLKAARRSGAARFIHLSSAAVQGAAKVLDERTQTAPFSAYSQTKAWAEKELADAREATGSTNYPEIVIVRATSVQGAGRTTTTRLRRLAASPLATVAAPGTAPTPVTSVAALAEFVVAVGNSQSEVPMIVLQPWEGLTVTTALEAAGGRIPRRLPRALCLMAVRAAQVVSRAAGGRLNGEIRRVELMWFGQRQVNGWAESVGFTPSHLVFEVLRGTDRECDR